MFQLIGRELYRWDLDRKVKLSIYEAIDEVHVAKHGGDEALIVTPRKEKGMVVADIPNILLQTARKITVYAVKDGATIGSDTFLVKYKEKPSGYVYTETEVKTWTKLEERIGDIEKNSAETIKQAVNDYLKENPLESGTSDAVQYVKQTLTEEQQEQARTNIGAASAKEVGRLSETIGDLKLLGGDSVLAEIVPSNNLFDAENLVKSFVDKDGNAVNGTFTNYIKIELNKRYVTNLNYTQFYFFDENKFHTSTATYLSNPQIITGNGGYLLVKLGSNYADAKFLEGTDIDAYKEQHVKIKSGLLDNKWYGKKWLCIGDSISTDESNLAKNGYAKLISRELGMTLTNIAVSGKVMKDGYEWLDGVNDKYDLITVMLGTNNQGYNCALGSLNDEHYTNGEYSSNNSFYAQTQLMAEKLKAKFPKSVIIFLTPIKRTAVGSSASNNDEGYQVNALGLTTESYRDVIIDVCNYYSLPYEDLYNCIESKTEVNRTLYFMSKDDGTHPNDLGHALYLAPLIKNAIVRQTPYYFNDWSNGEDTGGEETVITYTITNTLTNVTSDNSVSSVEENASYSANLTVNSGYTLDSVTVTMSGTDITSSAYSNGVITIPQVTGNIVIIANAIIESTGEESTEPVLLHSYASTPIEFTANNTTYTMLEDLANNLDLKIGSYWYDVKGVNVNKTTTYRADKLRNESDWKIEKDTSFSIKFKQFNRNSNYFSQLPQLHTGGMQGVNIDLNMGDEVLHTDGRMSLDISAPEGSTSVFGSGRLRFGYYKDGVVSYLYGNSAFANAETHDITLTFDATTKNVKVYQDTDVVIDETLDINLRIDGINLSDLTYASFDSLEIYKGVIEVA